MSAVHSIARPSRFSPMSTGIPASLTDALSTRIAVMRGLIGPQGHLAELPGAVQRELREDARMAIHLAVRGPKETMLMHLRRDLANELFGDELAGIKFDELTMHERQEVAAAAAVALGTMLDVLAGTAQAIPAWEQACLNFEGPYDPALLETSGTVQ